MNTYVLSHTVLPIKCFSRQSVSVSVPFLPVTYANFLSDSFIFSRKKQKQTPLVHWVTLCYCTYKSPSTMLQLVFLVFH